MCAPAAPRRARRRRASRGPVPPAPSGPGRPPREPPSARSGSSRDPQRDRLGRGVGLRGGHEADQPVLADRPHAVAEVERATLGKGGQPHDLGRAPPSERHGPAGGALGERPQREAAQSGLRALAGRRPGSPPHRRRRRRPRAPPARPAPTDARPRPARPGSRRCSARPPGSTRGAPAAPRRALGCGRSRARGWSRRRRTAGLPRAARRRVSTRSSSSSGRTTRPLLRRQAAERPRSRRDGEAVEDRLGQVGPRVPGRDPVASGARAQLLGGGVARIPRRGLEVSGQLLGSLDVQIDPQPRAEVAADALVAIG